MKKHKLITIGVLLLSLLLCGCNSETDRKTHSELDELIKSLPAARINDGKINFSPVSEEENNNIPYSSITGKLTAASSKEITVNCSGKEYKFTVDGNTKIFGGEIKVTESVTVTYEGDLSDKKTVAEIITVLSQNEETEEISSQEPITAAETDADDTTANEATAGESATPETAAATEASPDETAAPETTVTGEAEASAAQETTSEATTNN